MEYHFTVPGTLPGLNDYLKAERKFTRRGGSAHSVGNDMKQENQMLICNAIRLKLKRLKIQRLKGGQAALRVRPDQRNIILQRKRINLRRNGVSGMRHDQIAEIMVPHIGSDIRADGGS